MALELAVPLVGREVVVHATLVRGYVPITCECGSATLVMVPFVGPASCAACARSYVVAEYAQQLSSTGEVSSSVNVGQLSAFAQARPGASIRRLD